MRQNESIEYRKGAQNQCGTRFSQARRKCVQGHQSDGEAIWDISESSVPVCTRSDARRQRSIRSRSKDGLYRETAPEIDRRSQADSASHRAKHKQSCGTGTGTGCMPNGNSGFPDSRYCPGLCSAERPSPVRPWPPHEPQQVECGNPSAGSNSHSPHPRPRFKRG